MKNTKISRRSFLLGLAACSAAGVLTACKGTDAPSGSTASSVVEQPASSAASSTVQQAAPFLTVEDFPPLDGSTACIPLMAQMLADLPEKLGETIPDFHNMEFRMKQLREAVAADKAGRMEKVGGLVADIEKDADEMCCAERLYREGKLPKRICHCDTKVSNMLFDDKGNVLCVIDLDTVMPSFVFSDFGDFLRSAANTAQEDEPDLTKVNFNIEVFKPFAKGYIESAKSFLTPQEIELLPYAVTLFPYMQAVRFLADYINGDTYYQIKYPEHNYVRTLAQYKLYQEAKKAVPEMKAYIASLLG